MNPSRLFFSAQYASTAEDIAGPYVPNPIDLLDVEIGSIINSQPNSVLCQRVDPYLNKAAADAQTPGERMAKYRFSGQADIMCKLIDRGGHRGKKVMCKVGGGEAAAITLLLSHVC